MKKNKRTPINTHNSHGWLFIYLQSICDSDDIETARKALVSQYSDGKTESLKELYTKYPSLYNKMRTDLSPRPQTDLLDKPRKRLIAALFKMLENQAKPKDKQQKITTEYVKAVACKAAKVDRFNDIPLQTLKSLYRSIGEKNMKEWDVLIKDLLNGIM